MPGKINHIGKNDQKQRTARYKRLVHSGIFRDKSTSQKRIDCQGDFNEWTNAPAKDWIKARVKELNEGRSINLSCDCCETTEEEKLRSKNVHLNENCYAKQLIELIEFLAKEQKSQPDRDC